MWKKKIIIIVSCMACIIRGVGQQLVYKDASQPVEIRVKDLLQRMTAEEKFYQLFMIYGDDTIMDDRYKHGIFGLKNNMLSEDLKNTRLTTNNDSAQIIPHIRKLNEIQKYFIENTRLGIPCIFFGEALHGVVADNATVFPQAIALAATFDTILMYDVASAIAEEAKLRGMNQVLSPVVNIANDVRWGRTEETYGEDVLLATTMGSVFVNAFEQQNIITTPKHFVANVGNGGRDSYPISENERALYRNFFPPFVACVQQGKSRSIMTAYNSYDGVPCSQSKFLLTQTLKDTWKFSGFVISDAGATGGANVLHNTSHSYAESGAQAIEAGLDVIFQTSINHATLFIDPFIDGSIDTNRINDAVTRVLRAKFQLGLFDHPYIAEKYFDTKQQNKKKQIAYRAATQCLVLLKNENNTLPINIKKIKNIAVIGMDATEARMGGYSGSSNSVVNILEGITKQLGTDVNVIHAQGCQRYHEEYFPVPATYLRAANNDSGLSATFYNNITLSNPAVASFVDNNINHHYTFMPPAAGADIGYYSARWQGKIIAPATDTFSIGLQGNDGFRMWINDSLVINEWHKQAYGTYLYKSWWQKNKDYNIKIEYYEPVGNGTIKLVWDYGTPNRRNKPIKEAMNAAGFADMAIIVAGIEEGEFNDRAILSLPGNQTNLINSVAAMGKPVVVVLCGGSAITMNYWLPNVDAVVMAWYAGEQQGTALADVLVGSVNPSGRLPITMPVYEGQLPLTYNHLPTGRGDDYTDLTGRPLFPFGFGLSYTTFQYNDLGVSKSTIGVNENITVSAQITNSGTRAGAEVVQVYVKPITSSDAQPVLSLKGFERVYLQPGETKKITIALALSGTPRGNSYNHLPPGEYKILIGSSSSEIKLQQKITVIN